MARYILEKGKFNQLEASRETGVSIGLVNRITHWLVERGYVAKTSRGYELVMPAAFLSLFPIYRKMEKLATATYKINIKEAELSALLKKHRAVLCLTSASQYYDAFMRDSSVHVYCENDGLKKELASRLTGLTSVTLYSPDVSLDGDVEKKKGFLLTNKLRTMIDLLCSNKAYAAESMMRKRWKK
ncbi:hypothetical protein HY992_03560 [Candidatus Micrarchaeota archaeon]|nr:hypothetical protein [Candidatus Micrarchaeota archaeon]